MSSVETAMDSAVLMQTSSYSQVQCGRVSSCAHLRASEMLLQWGKLLLLLMGKQSGHSYSTRHWTGQRKAEEHVDSLPLDLTEMQLRYPMYYFKNQGTGLKNSHEYRYWRWPLSCLKSSSVHLTATHGYFNRLA